MARLEGCACEDHTAEASSSKEEDVEGGRHLTILAFSARSKWGRE